MKLWAIFSCLVVIATCAVEQVRVDTSRSLWYLDQNFVGAGWEVDGFLNSISWLDNAGFRKIFSYFGPGLLRVGGISADWVNYTLNQANEPSWWPNEDRPFPVSNWKELAAFAQENKFEFLFTLNELYGRNCNNSAEKCTGEWDTENLRHFLTYISDNKVGPIHGFELGNELTHPNYPHIPLTTNIQDYHTLNDVINSIWTEEEGRPPIFGPSTDYCNSDTEEFMQSTKSFLKGFTYHSYPGRSGNELKSQLLSINWLKENILVNDLHANSSHCIKAWNEVGRPVGMQLYLTETNSAYSSVLGVMNAFENSFWYLASLGQYAAAGVSRHCRWALFGQNGWGFIYSDNNVLAAIPDFWVALAFKQTVGSKVLSATSAFSSTLVYAFCGKQSGSVTLAFVNPQSTPVTLELTGINISGPRDEYVFTSPAINSGVMLLNGKEMSISTDGTITPLTPSRQSGSIVLQAYSLGFLVFPEAGAAVCRQ